MRRPGWEKYRPREKAAASAGAIRPIRCPKCRTVVQGRARRPGYISLCQGDCPTHGPFSDYAQEQPPAVPPAIVPHDNPPAPEQAASGRSASARRRVELPATSPPPSPQPPAPAAAVTLDNIAAEPSRAGTLGAE